MPSSASSPEAAPAIAFAEGLGVEPGRRGLEATENRERQPVAARPGCRRRCRRRRASAAIRAAVLSRARPVPRSSVARCCAANSSAVIPGPAGLVLVDPGAELLAVCSDGKVKRRSPRSPFGIDGDGRNPVDGGLLQEREAQAGLPAAGHPDAHRVRDQLARIEEERREIRAGRTGWNGRFGGRGRARGERTGRLRHRDHAAQVEGTELFDVDHFRPPKTRRSPCRPLRTITAVRSVRSCVPADPTGRIRLVAVRQGDYASPRVTPASAPPAADAAGGGRSRARGSSPDRRAVPSGR